MPTKQKRDAKRETRNAKNNKEIKKTVTHSEPRVSHLASRVSNNKMITWLFWAPLKFTVLFAVLFGITMVITNLIFRTPSLAAIIWAPRIILAAVAAISAFSVYKLIRWTHDDPLDQKSFVMLNIAKSLLSLVLIAAAGAVALQTQAAATFEQLMALGLSTLLLLIYLGGIGLLEIKLLFVRARAQGAAKWKLWLSIPFGIGLFWYSGFLVADSAKKNQVVSAKSKFWNGLSGWITASRRNTLIAFVVILAVGMALMSSQLTNMILFGVISAIIILCLRYWKRLRDNLGGLYASIAMILNIVVILGLLGKSAYDYQKQPTMIQEQIEITEVMPALPAE
ncbi:MAG: hypothetical protein FWF97_00275 [Alphaproteobacteria bacterium]|nr:hypothetical protein [Alphaproteobacteria bacterium]